MHALNGPVRTTLLSLVMVTALGASTVGAQTFDFGAPIPSAADSRFSTQGTSPQTLSGTTTFKAPNFFKQTLTDFRNLSSTDTLTWLAIGTVASTAVHPSDLRFTQELSSTPAMEQLRAGNIIGGKEFQFGASIAALAIGKMSGNSRVSDVAGKVLRAQIVAQTVTGVMKQAAQRPRPDGSDMRSFPSGHTSVSFASATVLQRELGWKVGAPAYAVASYVALARVEGQKHFLSDVAFGAAIGILAGRTVTIGSGEKRFAVSPVVTPGGGAISFSLVGNGKP
jgi:membrane-associated phospholipid phosphatase